MFQYVSTVQCALFMCHDLRALYLFKESTPFYLLAKTRAFCLESTVLFIPKVVTIFQETFDVFGLFLKMFRHFRKQHVCS